MNRRIGAALAVAIALGAASAAKAETYTFTGALPLATTGIKFNLTQPGTYEINWSSPAPIVSGSIRSESAAGPPPGSPIDLDNLFYYDAGLNLIYVDGALFLSALNATMTPGLTSFSMLVTVIDPLSNLQPCVGAACLGAVWRGHNRTYTPVVRVTTDPQFAGQAYTLTVTAVPEPATWAMLIGGFGLIGLSMRRRRAALAAN